LLKWRLLRMPSSACHSAVEPVFSQRLPNSGKFDVVADSNHGGVPAVLSHHES
jgi:hypothetical protein